MSEIIKEKIYKLLYEKYKNVYRIVKNRADSVFLHGSREDKDMFIESLHNEVSDNMYGGVISRESMDEIKLLEYLINDDHPVK